MAQYIPPSARGSAQATAKFLEPREGVPAHMHLAIKKYLCHAFQLTETRHSQGIADQQDEVTDFLAGFELTARQTIQRYAGSAIRTVDSLLVDILYSQVVAIDVLDYSSRVRPMRNANLEDILRDGGSVWTVDTSGPPGTGTPGGLVRRQPEETQATLARVLLPDDKAAQHLRRAWHSAYGVMPAPGDAYSEAIKALEATLCSALLPKDPKSTLGLVISALKAAPQKTSWRLTQGAPGETLIGLLEALWKSQYDRHGTADSSIPVEVSQVEAEGAVELALFVLSWLRAGVLTVSAKAP